MPPRIPVRFPWPSKSSLTSLNSSLCLRTFTSTPPSYALGPESPNYIEVPKPVQPTFPPNPIVKGVLPVPRSVFKNRGPHPKDTADFISQTTPDALPHNVPRAGKHNKLRDYVTYKRRLAESRKQALRDGVAQLHERKTTTERLHLAAWNKMQAENRALAMAPPRHTDVLTATTVSKTLQDYLHNKLPSTSRTKIVESRRPAFQRRMEQHAAVRRARLHDLYTNAREFIVDEERLDEAIEKAFGTEEEPMRWDNEGRMWKGAEGLNPWHGPMPDGTSDMLQRLKTGEGVGLARERVKKVAEVLTGGKM
ncbi:uncharacterized protein BDR25DRAFT_300631 [Lindgomyces ingoldianus]|uniref:Uncharacterized protein n=1 Tax=Lindgomyces ingoldianus TaxID=673940 RepID=A0ACB6RBU2_9PLEO|nr:uncharacterized protein BDR25DRAFT_300631 [Lindgomyces ingoldianus]KAF2476794.1 hypothetical protein BDR25DRAFT_300631 [Lindgomyces ingoldianus]